MRAACGLAEDIRDAVVEYQVSLNVLITFRMAS
jgi:hypothetical protein